MNKYDIVIGLEVHAELKTATKVFCSCKNSFGDEPNSNCCPVCVGLPGALPIINKKAVELTVRAGLCFGCEISPLAVMERKNYFYPDLAKAYQISQLVKPICLGGGIKLDSDKFIRLNRIHLEEDAGKLIHKNTVVGTYIDYNRGGVPLIEIVTEPDISSADEAVDFLTKLRSSLMYADIANCKMEQGGMRCDVNLSVKLAGSTQLGTRTEMKNLSSFKAVRRAIAYESQRQIEELEQGHRIIQQTRKWDDNKGKTFSMRSKEESQDYRYFPDPDILSIEISREDVNKIRKEIPPLAHERQEKYVSSLKLPQYDAKLLTEDKELSDYFESCLALLDKPKSISNWILTELFKVIKEAPEKDIDSIISPTDLTDIITMVEEKEISRPNGKELFERMCQGEKGARKLAESLGMLGGLSEAEMISIIDKIIDANKSAVEDYKSTPEKVTNFFIGQLMRESKGKAKVDKAKALIVSKLENIK